jgi:hypothetical protein
VLRSGGGVSIGDAAAQKALPGFFARGPLLTWRRVGARCI